MIVENLLHLTSAHDTHVLSMVFEQLPSCLKADELFAAQIEPKITGLVMDVFAKRNNGSFHRYNHFNQ